MAESVPKRKPKRAAHPKRPRRKPGRDNPFQRLQKTVEGLSDRQKEILRIAPAIDQDQDTRLKRLEKDMRKRREPGVFKPRKEFNI